VLDARSLGGLDEGVDAVGLGVEKHLADTAERGFEGLRPVKPELGDLDAGGDGQFGGIGAGGADGNTCGVEAVNDRLADLAAGTGDEDSHDLLRSWGMHVHAVMHIFSRQHMSSKVHGYTMGT
jgi:hypothetical protein